MLFQPRFTGDSCKVKTNPNTKRGLPSRLLNHYQAVFFDFDGVVAQTLEDNYRAWAHVFSKYKVKINPEEYFLMEGRRSIDIVQHFLLKNGLAASLAPKLIEHKHAYYAEHHEFKVYAGVEELIQRIKSTGIKVALVSGGSATRLRSPPSSEVLKFFDLVITGDDCPVTKPAPDPYLLAATKLSVSSARCLVIENAPLGIESAKNAGMQCIALSTTLAREHLTQADLVLNSISEVKVLLLGEERSGLEEVL
jgi:beta-phosphoglucomutase